MTRPKPPAAKPTIRYAKDAPGFLAQIQEAHPGAVIEVLVPVLWQGWDLDTWIAVVQEGGHRRLLTTDHGRLRRAEPKELRDLITRAQESVTAAQAALSAMGE